MVEKGVILTDLANLLLKDYKIKVKQYEFLLDHIKNKKDFIPFYFFIL